MNVVEKREFINRHLNQIDENLINQFYDALCKEEILKPKLMKYSQESRSS